MPAALKVIAVCLRLLLAYLAGAGAAELAAAAARGPALMRSEEPRPIRRHGAAAGEPWRPPAVHEVMAHVHETDPLLGHVLESLGAHLALDEHGQVHLHKRPEAGEAPHPPVHVPYLHGEDEELASLLEPEDDEVLDDEHAAAREEVLHKEYLSMSKAERAKLLSTALKNVELMCPSPVVNFCGLKSEPSPPDTGQNCHQTSGGCPKGCRCCLPFQDEECPEEASTKGQRFYKCVTDWRINACTTDGSRQCRYNMLCNTDMDCKKGCVCCRLPGVCPEGGAKCFGISSMGLIQAAKRVALVFHVEPEVIEGVGEALKVAQKVAEESKDALSKGLKLASNGVNMDLPFLVAQPGEA